ncbi:hypothetical protein [Sphingomonas sp. PAMC 26617]|uniref:hypothetical protein n=1 Tax=Sphingomonas sp. PAMC 26617 TaxID=1112216 RepID=UPI0012F48E7A|nr:hypothetical protein [Sphingomonas sp. PAMC 26617]
MDQNASIDDPVRAFDALRREVSLALRATQGLAAEHSEQPDYTETLKAMDDRLGTISASLAAIGESPAMRLTPGNLGASIVKASEQVRAKDADLLQTAHATSATLVHQLRLAIQQVDAARVQKRHLMLAAAGGFFLGILLWSILPGVVMRALPARWAAPEWMATRTMRMDRRQAGVRLLALDKPAPIPIPSASPSPVAETPKPHRRRRR